MLFRLAYLGVTNALAMLRLLPISDRAKDAEILALRHHVMILERQLHGQRIRFTPADADNDVRPGHGWFEPWQRDRAAWSARTA